MRNTLIDWLRGGNWRGDSEAESEVESTDVEELEKESEEDNGLLAMLKDLDEELEYEITLYEYANTDFRQRLRELRKNAGMLETEPLVGDQYEALMIRIGELELTLDQETKAVSELLEQHRREIEKITGEAYDEMFREDEPESDDTEADEENEEIVGESFADLHGLDPNAEPEDVSEDDPVSEDDT